MSSVGQRARLSSFKNEMAAFLHQRSSFSLQQHPCRNACLTLLKQEASSYLRSPHLLPQSPPISHLLPSSPPIPSNLPSSPQSPLCRTLVQRVTHPQPHNQTSSPGNYTKKRLFQVLRRQSATTHVQAVVRPPRPLRLPYSPDESPGFYTQTTPSSLLQEQSSGQHVQSLLPHAPPRRSIRNRSEVPTASLKTGSPALHAGWLQHSSWQSQLQGQHTHFDLSQTPDCVKIMETPPKFNMEPVHDGGQ